MCSTLPSSGSGVMLTPLSHGMPIFSLACSAIKRARNWSTRERWTMSIFKAVQRWPLKDSACRVCEAQKGPVDPARPPAPSSSHRHLRLAPPDRRLNDEGHQAASCEAGRQE
jgi:hypothetical protein